MTQQQATHLLDELITLYKNYSEVHRLTISYDKYDTLSDGVRDIKAIEIDSPLLRMSLHLYLISPHSLFLNNNMIKNKVR